MQKILLSTLVVVGWILPIHALLEFTIIRILLSFIVNLLVLTVILYVAGLIVVRDQKTKITNAFAIALLGTAITLALNTVVTLLPLSVSFPWEYLFAVRIILYLAVWLSLIKIFYKTDWLRTIAVALVTIGIMLVVEILLASVLLAIGFI